MKAPNCGFIVVALWPANIRRQKIVASVGAGGKVTDIFGRDDAEREVYYWLRTFNDGLALRDRLTETGVPSVMREFITSRDGD